ncbi:MAG: hypothetical protein P4L39_03165 [Humidesulfovibrio sp.]|nr:hypothetical protein [Humidesulfovibrio sp.]
MALYPCPGCKREISTDALKCPHCGKSLAFSGSGARFNAMPKAVRVLVIALGCFFAVSMLLNHEADNHATLKGGASAPTATSVEKGPLTIQPGQWFGFSDRGLMEQALQLQSQDRQAHTTLITRGVAAGEIVRFYPGEIVYVEGSAPQAGLVEVRRKGQRGGWWTNAEAVKDNEPARP